MTIAEQYGEAFQDPAEYVAGGMDMLQATVMQTPLGTKLLAGAAFTRAIPYEVPEVDVTLLLGDKDGIYADEPLYGYEEAPLNTRAYAVSPTDLLQSLGVADVKVAEVVIADDETVSRMAALLPQLSKRFFVGRDPQAGLRDDTVSRIGLSLEAAANDPATHVLVARNPEHGGITATLTFVELPNDCLMIEDVVVDNQARGAQGCGELNGLLKYVAQFGQEHDSSAIVLTTEPNRPDAVRAYEKRGFEMIENVVAYTPAPVGLEGGHVR